MLRSARLLILLSTALLIVHASIPELAAWQRNTTGQIGYNGLPANVQMVRYSANNVYVNSSGIPSYTIGPWPQNPNMPTNQNYLVRIPRTAVPQTGTTTNTPLGKIGMWINGLPIYNPLDGRSYLNQNTWHQNANVVEAPSYDSCLGHPDGGGRYHHHLMPSCLYTISPLVHAPIVGYAFDGFPVYGPHGYAQSNGSGGIKRIASSYRLRNITQRTTLPNGTALPANRYGPLVSATYPLGYYVEDYEYVSGLGDLDQYNGRFIITPEYPNGIYAYFVTHDQSGNGVYPYIIGPSYYGQVATDNLGQNNVIISETVTPYLGEPSPTNTATPAAPTLTPSSTATAVAPTLTPTARSATGTATTYPAPTLTSTVSGTPVSTSPTPSPSAIVHSPTPNASTVATLTRTPTFATATPPALSTTTRIPSTLAPRLYLALTAR